MKKIRIGNDIVIKWRVTINGEEVNLEGLDLALYISTTYQPRKAITFTVAGNEITATYKGTEQRVTGVYRLTLYRNEGENSQSILDACDAFELVSCSCLTTDVAFGGAEVELPIADLGIGVPGLSAYEIAVAEGFKGTQEEWIASLSAASEAAAAECRKFTEKAKISEQERQDKEALRVTAEDEREANETARQSSESTRATAERSRTTAEQQRVTNETARSNAESQRVTAETARQEAETARQEAEQGRMTAEQQRADAEAARAEEFATFAATLAAKEDAANKVTSIGADADDQHYPSAKAVREMVKPLWAAIEDKYWYGVEKDTTVSTPTCTRIGNMDFHRTLPIHSLMRGCLLADDGTVNKYLDPDDWTSEVRDGSQGQVMVEIPRHYRKCETDGNIIRVKLSLLPLDGFIEIPKMYVSAYEAALERSTLKLCSVVNEDTDYRGGTNDSTWDGTYKSQLGMPVTYINRTNFRQYARNRNTATAEWNCYTYDAHVTLWWLFVTEYATLNTQLEFKEQLTDDGYRQGGLGNGLSPLNGTQWLTYNSQCPIVRCGYTDNAGNKTTQAMCHIENDDASISLDAPVPRYRGVEHPFAHIAKIADGVIVVISPTEANGGDGTSKVYVASDPRLFNDTDVSGYRLAGLESRESAYIKSIQFGEFGDIVPTVCEGAGSSTYYSDFHYTKISTTEALRIWILCGDASSSGVYRGVGFMFIDSHAEASSASPYTGTRLCFIPQNK